MGCCSSPSSFFTLFFSCSFLPYLCISGPLFVNSIKQPFTVSHFQFIDQSGAFLISSDGNFTSSIRTITGVESGGSQYYLFVTHVKSNVIIWTGNRNKPISDSDNLYLTTRGLVINSTDDSGKTSVAWSTPALNSSSQVSFMQLQNSGNLVLLDRSNVSVWQSFDHPTDTIVMGQSFAVGTSMDCDKSGDDKSVGDYTLAVTGGDTVLQWNGTIYWKLSMDTRAYKDLNLPVSYMGLTDRGLVFLGSNRSIVVIRVSLGPADFRIGKLDSKGKFSVSRFVDRNWVPEFQSPADDCRIPFICNKLGLCTPGNCSCPSNFRGDPVIEGSCRLADASLALPSGCSNRTELNSPVSFVMLGNGMDYFANGFAAPAKRSISLLACQDLCKQNCSCLGIFHGNSSGSCYLLENKLGSLMPASNSKRDLLGYVKTIVVSSPGNPDANNLKKEKKFPVAGVVLLPLCTILFIIILALVFVYWRKNRIARMKSSHGDSSSSEHEIISIPGLPVRFSSEELVAATEDFSIQIGSGGFGTVYKGTLPDKSIVAVKKITNVGMQGKKEFFTEIAIIGSTHHFNLVKLKGFCVQGRQRFLVYEYMNRGSLDRTLFGLGPVLEWQERFEIALGTARGLAYLHSSCEHKIVHCDVKPENILLNDNLQVKISDFGLSKLLTREQSNILTTMRGTRGYLAPEWLTGTMISDKADVYSYGMVLLEIVRGRKNTSLPTQSNHSTENDSSEGTGPSSSSSALESRPVYFPLLALEMHLKGRYLELADSRLERRVTSEEVEKLVKVALCCLHEEPMLRPAMVNVVGMLEGIMPLAEPRLESLNFLRFYGRRFIEASRVEGSDAQNELVLFPLGNANLNSTTTSSSYNSMSYMSAQQLSGPR